MINKKDPSKTEQPHLESHVKEEEKTDQENERDPKTDQIEMINMTKREQKPEPELQQQQTRPETPEIQVYKEQELAADVTFRVTSEMQPRNTRAVNKPVRFRNSRVYVTDADSPEGPRRRQVQAQVLLPFTSEDDDDYFRRQFEV